MYQRHYAVLAIVVPFMAGFAACAVGAVATFEYMPLPLVTRQWILAMVRLHPERIERSNVRQKRAARVCVGRGR